MIDLRCLGSKARADFLIAIVRAFQPREEDLNSDQRSQPQPTRQPAF